MLVNDPIDRKICWRITRVCNLHCQHCLAGHANKVIGELSREQRFEALSHIGEAGVAQVTWTGGEPTMCEDLPDLIAGCHQRQIRSIITTHGLALKDSFLEILDAATDRMRISFDGLEETHNKIRRGKVFRKAVSSISRCLNFLPVEANVSVLRANIEEIPALAELLIDEGVSTIVLLSMMMRESAIDNGLAPPSVEQTEALRSKMADIADRFPQVRIRHNAYNDGPDRYIVIESNGAIMLCSDFSGDVKAGFIVGASVSADFDRALREQTLAHRKVHLVR